MLCERKAPDLDGERHGGRVPCRWMTPARFSELGAETSAECYSLPGSTSGHGVTIPSSGVAISGGATDVWVFQISQGLTVDSGAAVSWLVARNRATCSGRLPDNDPWNELRIQGSLCKTAIVLIPRSAAGQSASTDAVTLDGNAVSPHDKSRRHS
jgi:hypothetical protein